MKILAIDSSGLVASAAVTEDEKLLAEYTVNYKKTHSQTLMPMVDEIVRMTELDLSTIDAVAVAGGPGSFTGLRIGSAAAKGLAQALNKPVIGVPTTEAMALELWGYSGLIIPVMDARRRQVYTGIYSFSEAGEGAVRPKCLLEQCALGIEELVAKAGSFGKKAVFTGDGVPVFKEDILRLASFPVSFAPVHLNAQRAGAVAALAAVMFREGNYTSACEHVPVYLRKSQAERERERAEGHAGG
ncbi:MAG: tRNA (adenosine(37)-N6)-threonylcarbamoyltransferase complex dimerization subunit type 1 TsaB [Lachnospiraceae bacterium]|nr:tRNA (adenosine(37)-N6)-threonylcarbamoyltransferase complex dimerization subunit type 1 TsaB [Lachnospiraceae bacterium]